MQNFKKILILSLVSLCVTLAACDKEHCKKDENNVVFKNGLELSPSQEVPATATKAFGAMNVSYDKKLRKLTYEISWSDLTGIPIGAHIHGTALRGVNAGIKHDFFNLIPKHTQGSLTNSVMVDGVAIKEDSLLMGFYYLNIHTPIYPAGELRGQIEF